LRAKIGVEGREGKGAEKPLSARSGEREGPAARRREGEVWRSLVTTHARVGRHLTRGPSLRAAPHPLPQGGGEGERRDTVSSCTVRALAVCSRKPLPPAGDNAARYANSNFCTRQFSNSAT
jgi:hypothetical protein